MLKAAALIAVFCSKFYASWCFFFSFNHEDVLRPKSQLPHPYSPPKKGGEAKGGASGSREQITLVGYQHPCRMGASRNLKPLWLAFFKMPEHDLASVNIFTPLPARAS